MKKLLGRLFLRIMGWKINPEMPAEVHQKCVLIAAPHTSNWDFPITLAAMWTLGVPMRFTIKKEWLGFPLGWFFRWTGAIGINRAPKKEGEPRESTVESIARLFEENDQLCVIVPAEGSRSLRKQWKTGFYYIAQQAKVPIAFGYLDYANKRAGIGPAFYPTGDLDKDMLAVMEFYKDIQGKHPALFSLDERYWPPKQ